MKILFAQFDSARNFLDNFDVDSGHLSVPTRAVLTQGDPVIVEIGYPGLPNRVLSRGRYLSHDADKGLCVVELDAGQEGKREFLLKVARGEVPPSWRRKHRRFPIRLPAKVQEQGTSIKSDAQTEDLGGGGVFLRTSTLLPENAKVAVSLDPCDGSPALTLHGTVAWVRADAGIAGIGVGFEDLSTDEMKRLRVFMRVVKTLGKVTEWEDASAPV
jgi:hypothetical protein